MTLRSLIPILFLSGSILLAAGVAIAANPDAATSAGPAATADGGLIEMNIFSELRDIVTGYTGESWWIVWIQVFLIVFLALLLDFIQRRVLQRFRKRLERTRNPWDDALLDALTAPISLEIWVLGIAFAAAFVDLEIRVLHKIITLSLIVAVAWFLVRLTRNVQANVVEMSRAAPDGDDRWDRHTVDAIGRLVRLSVTITASLIALQHIGVNISAVLAFGGIGGIALGFAAKDLLANFFGGLMIYLDRPFRVGDWIRSPDREIEGTVEQIGWRITLIRTFDKRPLYIPNSIFTSIAIQNPQRMLNRRIKETIGIRYDDIAVMDVITKDVTAMLKDHPEIDTNQLLMVYFNAFGPSSIDFFIYTFTKTTNWQHYHKVKHDVLIKISAIIARHGAEIAFPTSTLHVASMPAETQAR